jgi:hypothetical protein
MAGQIILMNEQIIIATSRSLLADHAEHQS